MTSVFIGLGANLGQTIVTLQKALADLHAIPGLQLKEVSCPYRSAPVDANGPDYVNAVAQLETSLSPLDLLRALQAVEHKHGRTRPYHHAPRTLDLDILLYGDRDIDLPELTLPHPRMHERAFVLKPLSELEPQLMIRGQPIGTWLKQCMDQPLERLADGPVWAP